MIVPTASAFRRIKGRWFQGSPMRNPRWFKYVWWIYTEDNPVVRTRGTSGEGRLLRDPAERMSTFDALSAVRPLDETRRPYFLCNWELKRADPDAPWDLDLVQRNGGEIAPAYEADPDTVWEGHK